MADEQKQQIIEYIFGNQEVPAHIMDEFSRWLLEHEGDPETESLMLEKWEEYSRTLFEEDNLRGLIGVRDAIREQKKRKEYRSRLTSILGVCTLAVLLFLTGYITSSLFNEPVKEITLVTANDNIGEFSLPDGTKVWLNEKSRLCYPERFSKNERNVKLIGQGFFEVRKDTERPFRVSMENIEVEVLGTSFGASCYKRNTKEEVVLKNGSVKVFYENHSRNVMLRPDERLIYSPFDGSVIVDTIDVKNTYRWYENYLSFDNARFGDILTNIEYRYRVNTKLLTSVSLDKRLSITIIHEPLETIMDVISTLLPIRYEIHGDSLIIRDKYTN